MLVPATPSVTVCGPLTAALAVAVTVITVVPASVPVLALTDRLTGLKSLFVIVPMPVNVAAAPENCTLRPLALKADSTNCNCSFNSTLLSPLIVTFTV